MNDRKNLKKAMDRPEDESVDTALKRVSEMQSNPETNLSLHEAESRLKRRKLSRD